MMGKSYEYKMEIDNNETQLHNVIIKDPLPKFFSFFPFLLFLFISALLIQGISTLFCLLALAQGTIFTILVIRGSVVKESVVIIPSFGVQLETHYQSGKLLRHFVPMDKILKPMLLECVTPVTCYWSLSLMLRDEDKLMLVFRYVKPPVGMLGCIWKGLSVATDPEDTLDPLPESFSVPVYQTQISG